MNFWFQSKFSGFIIFFFFFFFFLNKTHLMYSKMLGCHQARRSTRAWVFYWAIFSNYFVSFLWNRCWKTIPELAQWIKKIWKNVQVGQFEGLNDSSNSHLKVGIIVLILRNCLLSWKSLCCQFVLNFAHSLYFYNRFIICTCWQALYNQYAPVVAVVVLVILAIYFRFFR